ncbi:MAG TPA: hypothetical protein VMT18_12705 [Planctomycetota bacterium]|nr:hypothetical protein [Planctomycetota bacterium]
MAIRIHALSSMLLAALAGCGTEMESARAEGPTLSPEAVAAMEARIEREGEAAAGDLVGLVVASPVALPDGELDRLGRLLIERSDGERLLGVLRERALAHPDDAHLAAWLERLEEYERSIVRGVDVIGY